VLSPFLTVRESLLFAARLRLPEHISDAEKRVRVADVLEQLGLAHVADRRVGAGLSGGEARRLTIGLELVGAPAVLVLDEATSGLDAVSAARVVQVLRAIAHDPERPTAVLVSIHQPSSRLYQLFDSVTLLAQGRTLYSGPGGAAPAEFFAARGQTCPEGYNVADWLLELASDVSSGRDDSWSSPDDKDAHELEDGKGTPSHSGRKDVQSARPFSAQCQTSFLTQYQVLAGREWKVLRRSVEASRALVPVI
jgi:ABC-type multidrug transport system ATPase subunit